MSNSQTFQAFKSNQNKAEKLLTSLITFLKQGEKVGADIEQTMINKVQNTLDNIYNTQKLKVALVGGFSEGKTSIAAAWIEKLDESTMKISHEESSNQLVIYDVNDDIEIIDTPGLFGFEGENELAKYKDITKQYVSEAHIILYVMNPVNPIKESQTDDLSWLFRTLNLLPRTIFVLSRFDEVADVEDEWDYKEQLRIKQENVKSRLTDLINLTNEEADNLTILGVAANPFDEGLDYWLENMEEFKQLSHIGSLQQATTDLIESKGGALEIAYESCKSVVSDVLVKKVPEVEELDRQIQTEKLNLEVLNNHVSSDLQKISTNIKNVKIILRGEFQQYFSDIILQLEGTSLDNFNEFFERNIGAEGININLEIQNIFESKTNSINSSLDQLNVSFHSELHHYNTMLRSMAKFGVNSLANSNLINANTVKAGRDMIVNAGKAVGTDLSKMLKFKPWGAVKMAKNLGHALAVFGVAMEAWDTWDRIQKQKEFEKVKSEIKTSLENQRSELISLIDSSEFISNFFNSYVELQAKVNELTQNLAIQDERSQACHEWVQKGKDIEGSFKKLA